MPDVGAAHPDALRGSSTFQWLQLESTDYRTYIANLRGIGCPERTIFEIVSADLDDLYWPRREPLLAKLKNAQATELERSQAASGVARLRAEEDAVLRKLFGLPEPTIASSELAPQTNRRRRTPPPAGGEETPPTMPIAFQPINTNLIQPSADDIEAMGRARQIFLAGLGTNNDVNSPEYLRRWQDAQVQADNLFGALVGRQTFLQYQAAAEAAANNTSAGPGK
jgi:hypothetical protein